MSQENLFRLAKTIRPMSWSNGQDRGIALIGVDDEGKKVFVEIPMDADDMIYFASQVLSLSLAAKRRDIRGLDKEGQKQKVKELKDKGYSNVAIAEQLGIGQPAVRDLLSPSAA